MPKQNSTTAPGTNHDHNAEIQPKSHTHNLETPYGTNLVGNSYILREAREQH